MESNTRAVVIIKDENDNFPYFTQNSYIGYISELAAINSVVLMEDNKPLVIKAWDADSGINSRLIYTILDEDARSNFTIDSSTGMPFKNLEFNLQYFSI